MNAMLERNFERSLLIASVILVMLGGSHQSQVAAAPMAASAANFGTVSSQYEWNSPSNANGTNDNVCTDTNSDGNYLLLTQYAFAIPVGSTITGILVEPKIGMAAAGPSYSLTLLKSGANAGNTKNVLPANTNLCTGTTFVSAGGNGDLWGTTWTPGEINNSGFGVRVVANNGDVLNSLVDAVRITVFYDPPAPATPAEVPEADTLLLLGGGMGGLATWLGWQFRKRRAKQ